MYTLVKPLTVRKELLLRGLKIFTLEDFERIFATKSHQTKYFLEEQVDEGFLVRIKKGLYTLKTDIPSEEEIANALYKPSYISFEYALAYYNRIPEMPTHITSATTKPTRLFTTNDRSYSYTTIKREAYTGYSLVKTGNKAFLIADVEKAIADYLYYVTIGKRVYNDRFVVSNINKEKLLMYVSLFQRESLAELVKKLYANN